MRSILAILAFALVVGACAQGQSGLNEASELSSSPAEKGLLTCDEYPPITAPAEAYSDSPIYVANEMPVDEIRAWASSNEGFVAIWLNRGHNGWVTVAFSEGIDQRQAEIAELFPNVGVVAVAVDWTIEELFDIQERANEVLGSLTDNWTTGQRANHGVVTAGVGVLTDEIRTEMESIFAGERLCLDGLDPADAIPDGPQPTVGEGWRLLVDTHQIGKTYRTGIATDLNSLGTLWEVIGLNTSLARVDFESEIVVWFGAVYSGSCPDIRLDDVIVQGSTLHADIVVLGSPVMCTADANPHTYVVAIERTALPQGPFVIQLDADGPPPGAPEERTVVDVDLSIPGSVAGPGQVGFDTSPPEPYGVLSGDTIEPGYAVGYILDTRCGVEWLGELNDVSWRTDESIPDEWRALADGTGAISVSVLLTVEPTPTIEATAGESTVIYVPSSDSIPPCS